MPRAFRTALAGLGLALALLAEALLPAAAAGIGTPNVVALRGVVGPGENDAAIGRVRLLHGDRSIPFAVLSAQRLTGGPAEDLEVLKRLGPGEAQLRVVGSPAALAPLLQAKPGDTLDLRGVLDDANRYYQLLDAEQGAPDAAASPAPD